MKNQRNYLLGADQCASRERRHSKTYSNLRKNGTIFFQVGLIIALLLVHLVFEMRFEKTAYVIPPLDPKVDESPQFISQNYVVETTEKPKEFVRKKAKPISSAFTLAPDFVDPNREQEYSSKAEALAIVDPGSIPTIDRPDDVDTDEIFNVVNLEQVPVFPGCENQKTNQEKIKCMSEKLNRIVQKNFDTSLAEQYGLTGIQKIQMAFTINKDGDIVDVNVRAPHPQLQKEALKIAEKIPKMTPGKQRFQPVSVAYYLPIVFKVQD